MGSIYTRKHDGTGQCRSASDAIVGMKVRGMGGARVQETARPAAHFMSLRAFLGPRSQRAEGRHLRIWPHDEASIPIPNAAAINANVIPIGM